MDSGLKSPPEDHGGNGLAHVVLSIGGLDHVPGETGGVEIDPRLPSSGADVEAQGHREVLCGSP